MSQSILYNASVSSNLNGKKTQDWQSSRTVLHFSLPTTFNRSTRPRNLDQAEITIQEELLKKPSASLKIELRFWTGQNRPTAWQSLDSFRERTGALLLRKPDFSRAQTSLQKVQIYNNPSSWTIPPYSPQWQPAHVQYPSLLTTTTHERRDWS